MHTHRVDQHDGNGKSNLALIETLYGFLEGATHANAIMPWGAPGPITLPTEAERRRTLLRAHLNGDGARVLYSPRDKEAKEVQLDAVTLAAFCPDAGGMVRWCGIDLDAAAGHGERGLSDPAHSMRCIAERADTLGLLSGLLAARSRSGQGRHLWLALPLPVPLGDVVLGLAALVAFAHRTAAADAAENKTAHAMHCADSSIAAPGKSGALELIPNSTQRPAIGWALTLPGAGAFRSQGGGVVVDPFSDEPLELETVPSCSPDSWSALIRHAQVDLQHRRSRRNLRAERSKSPVQRVSATSTDPLNRVDQRTKRFIEGDEPQGNRNRAAFVSACNLVGCGVEPAAAEKLVLDGARRCGLPEREARNAIHSAFRRKGVLA